MLFAFVKNCLSVVIISRIWDVVFILFFVEPVVAQHYLHWHFLALMELPRQLSIICTDMVIPNFMVELCAKLLVCRLYLRPKLL